MDIEIDPNEGGDDLGYQFSDDRFYMVVWVDKSRLCEVLEGISALRIDSEVVFGTIGCGERVWVVRDESGYSLAVGGTDSKDICYRITDEVLGQLLAAEAA